MKLNINPEFRDLIPRLSADEYKGLEESIIADGCRDALIVWNGTVIDGHNRYKICTENNIEFEVAEIDFADESEAKIWIIKNQFARRNISTATRAMLALELEPLIAAKAKGNIREGGSAGGKGLSKRTKALSPVHTRQEVADIAGVGASTIYRVKKVKESDNEEVKQKMLSGEIPVAQAYREVMPPKPENQKRVCTSCGKEKKVSEFTNNQTCNECYQDQRSRLKQFSGSELILEEMAKKEPHDGGNGTDLDNQIVTEYMDFIKSVHVQINKYLLCPSLFSGAEIALSDSLSVKKDIETIIDFIKGD